MQRSAVIKKNEWFFVGPPSPEHEPQVLVPGGADRKAGGEPKLRFVHEGGAIKQIIITCPCGEELVLDCVYQAVSGEVEDVKDERVVEEKR